MGSITLLLGKNRRRRKQAMAGLGHARLDSRNRPEFLVLTATQRKAEGVRREFLSQDGKPPAFAPEVRVFSEYLEFLATRHVSNESILSEPARNHLALTELKATRSGRSTSLPEAEALARVHAQVAESLLNLDDLQLSPDVSPLVRGLGRRIDRLPCHTTLQSALGALSTALLNPPESLKRDLQRFSSVVIDDILQLTPLRRNLLVSLCRTWQHLGTKVVVCFESSRGLGGNEIGAFFDFDPLLASAYPLRAFDASKALRCFLFEELIGQGDGKICVATSTGPVFVEPGAEAQQAEPLDLSDHVYANEPVPITTGNDATSLLENRVTVLECQDSHEEHRTIAGRIRTLIDEGSRPQDCCVAVADLERQLPVLSQVFRDHGLALDVATGPVLASLPVPAVLLSIPQALEDPAPALSLLQALQTDLVRIPDALDLPSLWAACVATGIHKGSPLDWLEHWESHQMDFVDTIRPSVLGFQALFDLLSQRFALSQTPASLRDALLQTCCMLGLPSTCLADGVGPDTARLGHKSWRRSVEVLESWCTDLQSTGTEHWEPGELLESARRIFQTTRAAIHPRRNDAVSVVGILELRGLTPRHLFLANLVRSAFPTPRSKNFLLPDEASRRLETVDPMSEARYLLMSALRNALGDGDIHTLTLSWPSVARGRETVPASALQDLLSLPTLGPRGAPLGSFILQAPGDPSGPPLALTGVLSALARSGNLAHTPLFNTPLLQRQVDCATGRSQDTLSPYDGQLSRPPPLPDSIGPTGVESYLKCAARYWYTRILRLQGSPSCDPQVLPSLRGSAMHRILERYDKEAPSDSDSAAALHGIAMEVFEDLQVGYVGDPILLQIERDRMSAGLVDDAPGGPLKAWLSLETSQQDWRVSEASEQPFQDIELGPLTLRGAIDRIDRLPALSGHLVIDFKTGSVPSVSHVNRGLAFQPIAYLEAVSQMRPGEAGIAAYMSVGKAGAVSFNTWVGDPALIEALVPKRRRRSTVALDSNQRQVHMEHAARSMERMQRGVFHTTLSGPEEVGCSTCDFLRICRINPQRNQRIAEAGGDLQIPFKGEER